MSQEETIGPSTRCEGHKQGLVRVLGKNSKTELDNLWAFVREVCHPGKGVSINHSKIEQNWKSYFHDDYEQGKVKVKTNDDVPTLPFNPATSSTLITAATPSTNTDPKNLQKPASANDIESNIEKKIKGSRSGK